MEKNLIIVIFVFIYKKGELSSISLELTWVQDFSLGILHEQESIKKERRFISALFFNI